MQTFSFQSPTRIVFGVDTTGSVGDLLQELGGSRVLFVTDKVLLDHGLARPVLESITQAGLEVPVVFSDVPPDSDLESVKLAFNMARKAGCDCVVALGGGSVLDTAKAANIGLTLDGDLADFEGINILSSRLMPFVAIPTTAGTGSEVSAVAMVKDSATGKKLLFGSRFLCADVAVLDPNLLVSLPKRLTAATGLDAVTHCIESYVAMTSNVVSDSLAGEALEMLLRHLPEATTNGGNVEARGATLLASSMAGLAFTNAGVGVVHALAHAVGGKFSTHHGLTNAIFLPYGINFNMESAGQRYARLWRRLSAECRNRYSKPNCDGELAGEGDDMAAATSLLAAVKDVIHKCGLPSRLREIGVPELSDDEFFELASLATTDPAIMFNPREASIEDLVEILRGAY